MGKLLGLFGGTFDPIHFGHLRSAWENYCALELDELRLIPSAIPPHREKPFFSSKQRVKMAQLAIKHLKTNIKVDQIELLRKTPSYSVDTIKEIKESAIDTNICFIMGADAFLKFNEWHKWQEILTKAHLIINCRPGYKLEKLASKEIIELLQQHPGKISDLRKVNAGKIVLQPVSAIDISSTKIREDLIAGKMPHFLLPQAVIQYIEKLIKEDEINL